MRFRPVRLVSATAASTDATEYFYRVMATNAYSCASDFSDTQSAYTLPIAPSNLQVTSITPDEVTLTWQVPTLATSFRIEQQLPDNSWTQIGTASADDNSITLNGTFNPTGTNSFRIEAYAVGGYSAAATMSVTGTAPEAPSNLVLTPSDADQIDLSWDATANATSYTIARSTDGTTWTTIADHQVRPASPTPIWTKRLNTTTRSLPTTPPAVPCPLTSSRLIPSRLPPAICRSPQSPPTRSRSPGRTIPRWPRVSGSNNNCLTTAGHRSAPLRPTTIRSP